MLNLAPNFRSKLKLQICVEEGFRQHPYKDTNEHLTVGYGRNLEDVGISRDEALYLLDNDITRVEQNLWHIAPQYGLLNDPRKCVVLDMAFNMGANAVMTFDSMWEAIGKQDWKAASAAMLDSMWAKEVGYRAVKLAQIMETGIML